VEQKLPASATETMWSRIIVVAFWLSVVAVFALAAVGCAPSAARRRLRVAYAGESHDRPGPAPGAEVANLKLPCVEAMLKLDAIYRRAAGETLQ
jgi:hypothetical protein